MKPTTPSFICASCARALRTTTTKQPLRPFSSTTTLTSPRGEETPEDTPRWKQTPPAMKMPIRLRPEPKQPKWRVNTDEEKLNQVYDRFLGSVGGSRVRGRDLLSEETKWLAITHKSHDHARQGFNDRLAYLGKRILDLQTSLALLSAPSSPLTTPSSMDPTHVYKHPALEGIENISVANKTQVLDKARMARVAGMYGLDGVVRWKPKKSDNLDGSGLETVLSHAVYAVVGAVAMQRGGEVAARTARERVLQPLGLR